MKIVEKGKPLIYTCSGNGNSGYGCGSRIELGAGDCFYTYRSDFEGGSDQCVTFICPVCQQKNDIKRYPYPPFKNEAEWRSLAAKV